MHPVWNASPEIIALGPLVLRWYGVLFATGFIMAATITSRIFQRVGQELESLDALVGYTIAGTIIGARLGHTLIYEPQIYLADPIRILKIWEGGLASHGGTLGAMFAVWLWNRKYRSTKSYLSLLDLLALPTTAVTTMIRLGNFFNSEILGRPTDFPLALVFARVDNLPRHPAMLYEAAAYFVNFLILRSLFKREAYRRQGLMFGLFTTILFSARFLIEFIKEVQVEAEAGMTLDYGQLLSIPFILAGIVLIIRALRGPVDAPATPLPEPASAATGSNSKKKKKNR
jgi:phosphatidylglycerol:prolipoprotein diacylglycerol transferase